MALLEEMVTLEKETRDFGFEWPHMESILDQIRSECLEIKESVTLQESRDRIQEEIGDLIHAVFSLCQFLDCDLEETIEKTRLKFQDRLDRLRKLAAEEGLDSLKGKSVEFALQLWHKVKQSSETPKD